MRGFVSYLPSKFVVGNAGIYAQNSHNENKLDFPHNLFRGNYSLGVVTVIGG